MNKPITLSSLTFSNDRGEFIVRKDYFMEFKDEAQAEIFIQAEFKYFTSLYGKITFAHNMNDTLTEIQIKSVLRLVSSFLGLRYRDVISKSQKREFVEARRFAVMICIDKGKTRESIYEFLKIDHSTVVHHVKQFRNLTSTDPSYRNKYDECLEFVSISLNGQFKEDGSGEKLKS